MQNEELRRSQLALADARDQYFDLFEFAPVGYLTLDGKGIITNANLTAASLLGMGRTRLVGCHFVRLVSPGDADRWRRFFLAQVAQAPEPTDQPVCNLVLRGENGSTFDARVTCRRNVDGDAEPTVQVVLTDISETMNAQRVLGEREIFLRTILDTAVDGFSIVDGEGRLIDVNPSYCAMSGYSREELLQMRVADLDATESAGEMASRIRRIRAQGSDRFDSRHRCKDGKVIHVSVGVRLIGFDRGLMVGFIQDVTERRRAEEALQESEERYRNLIDHLNAGVVVHGPDTRIVLNNARASELLGLSVDQLRGMAAVDPSWRFVRDDETTMPSEEFPVARVIASGEPVVNQVVGIDRSGAGGRVWVLVNAFPVFLPHGCLDQVVVTFVDFTEKRALESRLALASRLAALGTLVAGVAHEINNPLAGTMAGQGLAIEDVGKARELLRGLVPIDREALGLLLDESMVSLTDAQEGGNRVARIVKDLTTFGRPDRNRARARLIDVVSDAMRWLPATLARDANITVEDLAAPDVMASAGQIQQVVLNLVTNAAKSSLHGTHGAIVIRVGPGASGMARLDVVDLGSGIEPTILGRIFEPFYSTRGVGGGTGLGLAISPRHRHGARRDADGGERRRGGVDLPHGVARSASRGVTPLTHPDPGASAPRPRTAPGSWA